MLQQLKADIMISIHAPREGSDDTGGKYPAKAAVISIHAPREGSDGDEGRGQLGQVTISIHAPREGSDTVPAGQSVNFHISIHAPREGSDITPAAIKALAKLISIHAPREGSDASLWYNVCMKYNFYPRSPRGERRCNGCCKTCNKRFLSTLPARGATARCPHPGLQSSISIHAPREGSDVVTVANRLTDRQNFYPRSPRGERQPPPSVIVLRLGFLSTLPARGATGGQLRPLGHEDLISIHAPREGSDPSGAHRWSAG